MAGFLPALEHKIKSLGHSAAQDFHDIIKHPQFLEGLLLGPEGPMLLAEAHRRGFLGKAINAAGLGGVLSHGMGSKQTPTHGAHGQATVTTPGNGGDNDVRNPLDPFIAGDMRAPYPGDMPIIMTAGAPTTCGLHDSSWVGQPFPLEGAVQLAAGAQAVAPTDLGDFHAATSNPSIITTNDIIPGNIEVFEASLTIASTVVANPVETLAVLQRLWIVERVNGIEKARWTLKAFGLEVDRIGAVTSGMAVNTFTMNLPNVPWHRKYDPNVPHALALQITRTVTTVGVLDLTLKELGVRP